MADQAAIVQELYNRIDTLPPEKQAIVSELAKRFGTQRVPDATAQAQAGDRSRALDSMQLDNPYNFVDNSGGNFWDSTKEAFSGAINGLTHLPTFAETSPTGTADSMKDLPAATVGRVADQAQAGNYGGAAGTIAGTGAGIAAPMLAGEALNLGVRGVKAVAPKVAALPDKFGFGNHLDPAEAAAVQYGRDNGVQMRTSVQTGSKLAANTEKILQHVPRAAGVAEDARLAEQSTLAAAGEREVGKLAPGSGGQVPQPLDAGEAIHKTAIDNEAKHSLAADDSYNLLRSIENQPQFTARLQTGTKLVDGGLDEAGNPVQKRVPVMEDIQLPVDYRGFKAAVKPLLAEALRPMSIAQEYESTGIKAMRNIVDSPDFVPASVADQDLGALKGIMRDSPQSRSVGQAKFAADLLSKQVDAAIERAGPDAVAALKQGRESTVAKYDTQDFQRAIGFKDVGTSRATPGSAVDLISKLTADGDRNISLLRQVEEHAPEHLPAIAQAKVQTLLDKVTAEAGMGKPTTALSAFNKQGPETRRILYGDRTESLQNFFTLAKKIGENPNPSGSGTLLATLKLGGLVVTSPLTGLPILIGAKPLARMLFEPTASRNLIAGMRMRANSPGAALLANNILKQAGPGAVPGLPVSSGTAGAMANGGAPVATSQNGLGLSGTAGRSAALSGESGSGAAAGAGSPGGQRSRFTTIEIPGKPGQGVKAEYKIVDLDNVQASHSGITFQPNPKSTAANVRDYTNARNQGKVIVGAGRGKFTPELHTQPTVTALEGPPVDDAQGQTIAGHGRTMMQERVYASNPAGAKALRDSIAAEASRIEGLDPQDAYTMKRPSLRRVISDEELQKRGPDARANLVADTNVSSTDSLTTEEKAIEDSRRVSSDTLEHIAAGLDSHGEDATLAKVLEGNGGLGVLDRLIDDGVVSRQERAGLATKDGLTPAGKDRITSLMLGRFFQDPAQIEAFPASLKPKLARIASPLAQVENRAGWNLTPDVRNAVEILGRMKELKIKNVDDFVNQDGLLGSQIHEPKTIALAKAIQGMGQRAIEAAAKQYAQDANYAAKGANTLMGDAPTPESAFADAFPEVKPEAKPKNALAPAGTKADPATQAALDARRDGGERGSLRLGGWYHGSKSKFDAFDLSKSHPGNEHGAAVYITNEPAEAGKYGGNVRAVEFTGDVFPDESKLDKSLINSIIQKLHATHPDAKLPEAVQQIKAESQGKKAYSNDSALQVLRSSLPGDFLQQSNAINAALKSLGYGARSYVEHSGAKTLAVFDVDKLRFKAAEKKNSLAK